jgi:hypothetical protein
VKVFRRYIIKDVLEYNYKLEREVKYKMLMNFGNKSTNSSVVVDGRVQDTFFLSLNVECTVDKYLNRYIANYMATNKITWQRIILICDLYVNCLICLFSSIKGRRFRYHLVFGLDITQAVPFQRNLN